MKIKHKFLAVFIVLILLSLIATSYVNFSITEDAVVQNALRSMSNDITLISADVDAFHEKAKSELVFGIEYPVFKEYFSLSETRAGKKYDKNNVLQFSPAQKRLKDKLDAWTLFIQSKFPIAETCLIDAHGQEHTRITYGKTAEADDYSHDESAAPFFAPTLKLAKGEVYVQSPYMSADAKRWVFAYTSPIVLDDGTKPAFYHFEIPLEYFQKLLEGKHSGRTLVIDQSGLIIADSRNKIDTVLKQTGNPKGGEERLKDYLPAVGGISGDAKFANLIDKMLAGSEGTGVFAGDNEDMYLAYKKLSTFGWRVVQIKSYSELLEGSSSLGAIKQTIAVSAVIAVIAAIIITFIVSNRITKPLLALTNAARHVAEGDLSVNLPTITSRDEVASLQYAMQNMMDNLKKMISEIEGISNLVDEASVEIKANTVNMANGMEDQANKSTQIATASEEMSVTINEIARNTTSITETAVTATALAHNGEGIVAKSVEEVKTIAVMVEDLAQNIKTLGGRSEEIGNIIDVINEIAEQTNLLALNAAIEAARAGEQGRGFAVVADEVRRLSERTAKSTLQIDGMVKAIQSEVQSAVKAMSEGTKKAGAGVRLSFEAGKALGEIVESVKELHVKVEQIATATNQLSNVSEQISTDIGMVASVSKDTKDGTEIVIGSASKLTELSKTLQSALYRFKL
ncbi:MAG: methyl-accepting chemotaxis protein [Deltaproteobacteria bacterium]|nr:methyl-accepting chemotaxis protein [Deltaproteobacteria bacterium]